MNRMPLCVVVLLAACGSDQVSDGSARGFEPPVLTSANPPVSYPPDLFEQRLDGTVVLRLHVTETGAVIADSTRVAESSGSVRLDSAALAGVERMMFSPALRDGVPVAATFLQPVHFRHPDNADAEDSEP